MTLRLKPKIKTAMVPPKVIEREVKKVWDDFGKNVWGDNMLVKGRNLIGKPSVAGTLTPRGRVRKFRKTRPEGKPPISRVPDSEFGLRYAKQPHFATSGDYTIASHFMGDGRGSRATQTLEYGGMTRSWWVWLPESGPRFKRIKGKRKGRKPDKVIFNPQIARYFAYAVEGTIVKARDKFTHRPVLSVASSYVTPRAGKEFASILQERFRPGGMSGKVRGWKGRAKK